MNQFKGHVIGGGRTNAAQSHLRNVADEPQAEAPGPVPETNPAAGQSGLARLAFSKQTIIPYAVVIGGLSGAIMAVIVSFVLTELRPPQDLRVPGIAEKVTGNDQRLQAQDGVIRGIEVELSRFADTSAGLVSRTDEQDAKLAAVTQQIQDTQNALLAATGTQSPVFGVAVAQLSGAITSGRPFEAEWVNIYALSANEPQIREMLMPLAPVSVTGVGSPAELRQKLIDTAQAAGVPHGRTVDTISYGMMRLQTNFGIWMGYASADLIAGELLATADDRLAAGNVAGAIAVLAQLTEPYAARIEPWLAEARRHQAAQTIAARMSTLARDRLSTRARAQALN